MNPTRVGDVSVTHRSLQIPEGVPVAICASALVPSARHVSLLSAWRRIADIWPGATLLLVGDGPSRASVEASIEEQELGDEVMLLGEREDLPDLFAASDLHVVAGESPGVSAAMTAASLASKPTIAPDDWIHRVFVKDGQTGALFTPGDVHAMAAAIASLIQDPFTAEKMGRNACERLGAADTTARVEMESRP